MTEQQRTLRPGLLVGLSTSLVGNVRYKRNVILEETIGDDGAAHERWETERTVIDPAEYIRGKKVRAKTRQIISSVCVTSDFGLLCPEDKEANLWAAVAEARALANEFNAEAQLSHVRVFCLTGRVAADDVEAVKAINSEIAGLLSTMEQGIGNLEVKEVREAASRAREIAGMLPPDAEARVRVAIDVARAAATKLVKAGEAASTAIDQAAIRRIAEARTAFLDLEDRDVAAPVAAATRSLDLAVGE